MRIRSRINYTFTVFFGVTTIALCITIYVLSSSSRSDLFDSQLQERLIISENFFLELENRDAQWIEEIRGKFLRKLPNEIEYYCKLDSFQHQTPDSLLQRLPADFKAQLSAEEYTYWSHGDEQGAAKIFEPNGVKYIVLVLATDNYGLLYLSKLRFVLILALIVTITLSYLLSFVFSRRVLKPIASTINNANLISAQNLDLRLTVNNENTKDELGMLSDSFNSLLDRLQDSFELQRNFVRYASHEMKNPLAAMIGEAEVALSQTRSEHEYVETIEKLKQSAEKLNVLVSHFLDLSKYEKATPIGTTVALDELIMEVIIQLSSNSTYNVHLEFNMDEALNPEDFQITADAALLTNALYNIIDNAAKFSPEGSSIEVKLQQNTSTKKVELLVRDQGIGIPQQDLGKVFEPLYRASNVEAESGSGIGLSLVHKVMEVHDFELNIDSLPGQGTTVRIIF